MAEIKLDGGDSKQRSMLVPILVALALLAAGGAWFAKIYLHPAVTGTVDRVTTFPVETRFTRQAGTVGEDQTEYALYVIAQVTLTDHSEVPLFVKDIHGTLTTTDGLEIHADAMQKADLPRLAAMFPKMKPAVEAAGPTPLTRDTSIPVNSAGSGYVIFAYNVPQSVWDKRQAATVSFDFYHQDPLKLSVKQ